MTEAEFEQAVVDLAHTFGWYVAGFRPARTAHGWRTPVKYDGKGFPDLTLVHPERGVVLFAELKVGRNRLEPDQERWQELLTAAEWGEAAPDAVEPRWGYPVGYRLWHPDRADLIADELSNGRITSWNL